jgi:hypothetical protein
MSQAITIPGGSPLPAAFNSSRVSSRPVASSGAPHSHPITNPLWVIVIGMACFFGVAALLLAWSGQ